MLKKQTILYVVISILSLLTLALLGFIIYRYYYQWNITTKNLNDSYFHGTRNINVYKQKLVEGQTISGIADVSLKATNGIELKVYIDSIKFVATLENGNITSIAGRQQDFGSEMNVFLSTTDLSLPVVMPSILIQPTNSKTNIFSLDIEMDVMENTSNWTGSLSKSIYMF